MTGPAIHPDEVETAQALEALLADPRTARQAIGILREELQIAQGDDRKALLSTIAMLERRAGD